jgi:hypothetical protein
MSSPLSKQHPGSQHPSEREAHLRIGTHQRFQVLPVYAAPTEASSALMHTSRAQRATRPVDATTDPLVRTESVSSRPEGATKSRDIKNCGVSCRWQQLNLSMLRYQLRRGEDRITLEPPAAGRVAGATPD